MSYLKEILKGMLIGIANVIPGVSGGTMAVSMGIYDKIISAVTTLFKNIKESIKTLLPYIIGAVVGIVGLSFLIEKLFEDFKIPTMMAFVGLILGGLPILVSKVKYEKFKITHLVAFSLFAGIIVLTTIMGGAGDAVKVVSFSFGSVILMLVLGFIAAVTMVVPGVSGSMILMTLGYYTTIIQTINTFIKGLLAFDMPVILNGMGILLPFGIGVLIGIFVVAKIIEFLLKRYPNATYWGIIGLVITSPFAILYGVSLVDVSILTIIVGIVTFVLGFVVANKLGEK